MYHSLIISGKNTYDEWGLVPTSRPLVNPPSVKTQYYKNPGGNGELDYTTNLTGRPLYEMREGSWEFWVRPEDEWANVYTSLLKYIHGKKHQVILEDDPDFFYTGRLSINAWKSDKHNSLVTIDYILNPYKESINENQDWLWDEHFERPIEIRTIKLVPYEHKTLVVPIIGGSIIIPTFTVSFSGETENSFVSVSKVVNGIADYMELIEGENKSDLITFSPGLNKIEFLNYSRISGKHTVLRNVTIIINYRSTSL